MNLHLNQLIQIRGFERFINFTDDSQPEDIFRQALVGHPIIPVYSGFVDTRRAFDWFR
jgi:hypothetical protein